MPERRPARTKAPARPKTPAIRVLLVDDHPLWRDTLRKVLERSRSASVVAEAADGDEAFALAKQTDVDVIVMDIQMPNRTGIEATRLIVGELPAARVLVLASSDSRAQVLEAVQAGACGYLIKTASSEDVREAVRRVHAGEMVFPPALASVVLDALRGPVPADGATPDGNVFKREGDFWTVGFDGTVFRLKDIRGARFLAELLRNPGREFHSLDLVVGDRRAAGLAEADADPVLDREAKAAFRARVEDLTAELAEAEGWGDLARAGRLREEIAAVEEALTSAVGLGGRDRKAASNAERARVNVTLAIKAALAKIAEYSPPLFEHLSNTIKTGTYCSYSPDPRAPIRWGS